MLEFYSSNLLLDFSRWHSNALTNSWQLFYWCELIPKSHSNNTCTNVHVYNNESLSNFILSSIKRENERKV